LIKSGLKPTDQIVIEGNGKLMDGMPVHPHPAQPEQASADQSGSGAATSSTAASHKPAAGEGK
jgi:hypothetical protein